MIFVSVFQKRHDWIIGMEKEVEVDHAIKKG